MTIHLAADHAGFKLKEVIKEWLVENDYKIKDHGAFSYNKDDDYPDFVKLAAREIASAAKRLRNDKGIIIGGSGQGEAMIANRYPSVRAVVYYGPPIKVIKLSRDHNDANVLALAGFFLSQKEALAAVKLWLKMPFSNATRHKRRIKKIS